MGKPKQKRECRFCRRELPEEQMVWQSGRRSSKCRECVRFLSAVDAYERRRGGDTSAAYRAAKEALAVQRWGPTDAEAHLG